MNKVCSKYKQVLPLEAFGTRLGVEHAQKTCKKCLAAARKAYGQTEHGKAVIKAWKESEAGKASIKRWNDSEAHKEDVKNYGATEAGKIASRKAAANMRETPGWKAIVDRYHQTEKYKAKIIRDNHKPNSKEIQQRCYLKRRAKEGQKLCDAMKAGLYLSLKTQKNGRKWESLVEYTLEDLMQHLEKQFQPGMTWENYGEWHLDHIQPRAAHCYEDSDDPDFKRCWALENLQPLWASENKIKSAKIVKPFQPKLDLMFKSPHALDKII